MSRMTHSRLRISPWLPRIFFLLLWMAPLFLLGEVAARMIEQSAEARGKAYGEPKVNAGWEKDEEARAALQGPDLGMKDFEVHRRSFELDGETLVAQVHAREELMLFCDEAGETMRFVAPSQPSFLAEAAAQLREGEPAWSLLRGAAREDCARAFADPLTASNQGARYYPAQEDGPLTEGTDWSVYLAPPESDGAGMLIVVRLSLWTEPFAFLRPGAKRFDLRQIRGNNVGFRGEDIEVEKPPGTFRIACVGGSTTMEGKADALTYPARMEGMLAEGGVDVEVINCGIDVMGAERIASSFQRYLDLNPDLVVHYNFINDLPGLLRRWSGEDADGAVAMLRRLLRRSTLLYRYANRWLLPSEAALRRDLEALTFESYRSMIAQSRAAGVAIVFVSFAYPDVQRMSAADAEFFDYKINNQAWGWNRVINLESYGYLVRLHNRMLEELCNDEGIPHIRLPDELNGGLDTFYDICHMYQPGIDRKATAVAEELRAMVSAWTTAVGRDQGGDALGHAGIGGAE